MGIKVTKGGKGPIGSSVKAPGGAFVHKRQKAPKEDAEYRTLTLKDGSLLRQFYNKKTKKWETQSILKPIKKK